MTGFNSKQQMAADKLQEPVAWQWLGSAHFRKKIPKNADITAWNPVYSAPQRPWAGLTDANIERIKLMTYEKETNADGEEQEAVNIDWLIKTTEHFCKEKNNGT